MKDRQKRKLPDGWRWTSLADDALVEIIMGQSPPGETYNTEGIGLPFFQGKADFGRVYPEPTVGVLHQKESQSLMISFYQSGRL